MVPNKAIVPVAIAISLFFVLICGAVAMIAAAPHMAVPQAVKCQASGQPLIVY